MILDITCVIYTIHEQTGNLLFRAGRLAQAEKALLRSVWLDKTDATALLDLGHLLARQLRHSEARVRFQQANAPLCPFALLALAVPLYLQCFS